MKYMYKKWQEYPASTQDKVEMKKRISKTWSMAWIMKMVRIRVKRRKAMAREEECSFSAEPWFNKTLVTRSPFWWARVSYFFRQNNILNSFFCDIGLLWDFCDILRIRYRLPKFMMIRECKANSLILPPLHSQTEMRFHHDPQSCGRFFLDPSSKAPPRLSSWILCPPHLMVAPRPRLFHSV